MRREAGEIGGGAAIDAAEFGEFRQQRRRNNGADAGNRAQLRIAAPEMIMGVDMGGDLGADLRDAPGQENDQAFDVLDDEGVARLLRALLFLLSLLDQRVSPGVQHRQAIRRTVAGRVGGESPRKLVGLKNRLLRPWIGKEKVMKKSRFTDAQILAILRQGENGVAVADLCREHGISAATYYNWRSKYGGMDASLMSEMKAMAEENRRLKKMYAEMAMQNELLKDALGKK